jgi:hypothetical protein
MQFTYVQVFWEQFIMHVSNNIIHTFTFKSKKTTLYSNHLKGKIRNSSMLRYMDTSLGPRIAYRIRIRYGYASDTPPIRVRRVSVFFFFHEYWIRGLIRILITDTAQPNKSTLSCPRRPSRLASRFPHASRRNPAPRPHPAASCAPAAGDWLRASASSLAVDEPPSRLAGCQRRVSAPATCPCPLTQHPVHSSPVPTHGALGSTY